MRSPVSIRYGRAVNWFERQLERLRSYNPWVVDGVLAAAFTLLGVVTSYGQDIYDDSGAIEDGFREPGPLLILSVLVTCVPVAFRRRWPLAALVVSSAGVLVHILIGWPEGAVPATTLFLTYSVAVWSPAKRSVAGLAAVSVTVIVLALNDAPGLDAAGMLGVIAQFAAVWAIGVAIRNRRVATDARVREADERAESERQRAARVIAEERLRIAQELHDVVAHSMSVIAVQAGVGAHVLDEHPSQARAALEAISATSRGTLNEMRRLLGVLRDSDGARSHAPAPGLSDLPQLVHDVHSVGVPVTLHVEGSADCVNSGVELSAYRVVQEALTNVIKHAGEPTRVDVNVRHAPGALTIEVVDDGRGAASVAGSERIAVNGTGHGLIGMRERVELWGGELAVGPAAGGGYRVRATLPYGDSE
jgi:signal transduction histidine kinase